MLMDMQSQFDANNKMMEDEDKTAEERVQEYEAEVEKDKKPMVDET